jgi:diguanylate cyclase (GGDEF)-like protein/PAS domain S-box-containing protein
VAARGLTEEEPEPSVLLPAPTRPTDLVSTRDELRTANARFAALLEHSHDLVTVLDQAGTILYTSSAAARLLGYSAADMIGTSVLEFCHAEDAPRVRAALEGSETSAEQASSIVVRIRHADGRWRHFESVYTDLTDDAAVGGIVVNSRDVTERDEAAAQLDYRAFHDGLTGLPNRAHLLDRLAQALARGERLGTSVVLLFLDLDRFKLVNDSLGHHAGDRLITEVGRRLVNAVRPGDMVARLGGDEFVVMAEGVTEAEAAHIASRIIAALARPVTLPSGRVPVVTTSIGIAVADGHTPEALLRDADTAMYRAKDRGKNRWEVFTQGLRIETLRRFDTERLLRESLDDGRLRVHYQPIVSLVTGRLSGAEALLRLVGADGEIREPAGFIAVAEESGLIVPIGAGVLDEACRQVAAWQLEAGASAPGMVSVNVTSRQVGAPGFVDHVRSCLGGAGVAPAMLSLELSEAALLEASGAALSALDDLNAIGVTLGIDDFGTGHGSLSSLKRFPVDYIKIDRSFVHGLGTDPKDTAIVRAVIGLSQSLGLRTIAVGVESADQLAALRSLGCDQAQGFHVGPPQPPDNLVASLAARDLW